jgi:hypothetical protein
VRQLYAELVVQHSFFPWFLANFLAEEVDVSISAPRRVISLLLAGTIVAFGIVPVIAGCLPSYRWGFANKGWQDQNGVKHVKWSYPEGSNADLNARISAGFDAWNAKTSSTHVTFERVDSGYVDMQIKLEGSATGACAEYDENSQTIFLDPEEKTAASTSYAQQVTDTVAHEIGHGFNLEHDSDGIMKTGDYTQCSQNVIQNVIPSGRQIRESDATSAWSCLSATISRTYNFDGGYNYAYEKYNNECYNVYSVHITVTWTGSDWIYSESSRTFLATECGPPDM